MTLHSDQDENEKENEVEETGETLSESFRKAAEKLMTIEKNQVDKVRSIVIAACMKAVAGSLGYGILFVIAITLAL